MINYSAQIVKCLMSDCALEGVSFERCFCSAQDSGRPLYSGRGGSGHFIL